MICPSPDRLRKKCLAVVTSDSALPLALLFPGLLDRLLKSQDFVNIAYSFKMNWGANTAQSLVSYFILGEVTFQIQYHRACFSVRSLVYRFKVAVVVDDNQIYFVILGKDISADLFPGDETEPRGSLKAASNPLNISHVEMYCMISADISCQWLHSRALPKHDSVSR